MEVIAAAETWLDGKSLNFFLSGLQKVGLVAVACVLPGLAKDLSTHRYRQITTGCQLYNELRRRLKKEIIAYHKALSSVILDFANHAKTRDMRSSGFLRTV